MNSRYIAKFTNGFWKVFDTVEYRDISLEYLRKDAVEKASRLNRE